MALLVDMVTQVHPLGATAVQADVTILCPAAHDGSVAPVPAEVVGLAAVALVEVAAVALEDAVGEPVVVGCGDVVGVLEAETLL